jgi:UDP-N-acetylglucosamine 2-epimerase
VKPRRVLIVIGTRPEAVKLALVAKALARHPELQGELCVTGQHGELLAQVLRTFELQPRFDLSLMRPDQDLAELTSRILSGMTGVLRELRPDWVLVQGDTTTAFATALAASYARVKVAHVEAGLRTGCRSSPWPEETNRRLIAGLAELHLAPTARAREALLAEGVPQSAVFVTGNPVVDALCWVTGQLDSDPALRSRLDEQFSRLDPGRRLILVTAHRRESFGRPLEEVCLALLDLVHARPDVEVLWPVHLNPHVQRPVHVILGAAPPEVRARLHLTAPLEYVPFVYLMRRACFVITDSGGVQEEAASLGRAVLVTRTETERPEAVDAGLARLVGADRERLLRESLRLLDDPELLGSMSQPLPLYGDGHASERIVEILARHDPPRTDSVLTLT